MKNDWLGKIGIQLILEDPFWGWLYAQLARKMEENAPDVSLALEASGHYCLFFHPKMKNFSNDPVLLMRVKHELLHALLAHPSQRIEVMEKSVFDLAADLCVDQFLPPYPDQLTIRQFAHLGLIPFQSAQKYYDQFLDILENGTTQRVTFLKKILADRSDLLAKHSLWRGETGNSNSQKIPLPGNLIKDAWSKATVSFPEKLWPLIMEGHRGKPIAGLNWRDQLHRLAQTSKHTRLVYKKNKRSRRYGVAPGLKIKGRHRLLVAIDTSGSVQLEELQLFFHEIKRLHRQGAEIIVVECDANIKRRYVFEGKIPDVVAGRGDTNYQPPIELLNEETDLGGLIYFTDGDGPPPFIQPKRPVLWIISRSAGGRKKYHQFPGDKAFISLKY